MGFFDHLEELRGTLIKCAVVYTIFAVLIGYYMREFNGWLLKPLLDVKQQYPNVIIDLGTTTIMEGFSVVIQMCCAGALVPATPFFLYFLGQFVAPALTKKELRMVLPVCFWAFVLFAVGSIFSFFFLVPSTLKVAVEINQLLGYALRWTPGSYYSLLTWLVLGVGAAFEFPLVILLLVYLGLLEVATLRKYRRHAIVLIFIIAAIVTPTPDPFTQMMFAIPLYILFEIAVLVASRVEKRRGKDAK
ncbi:MAG: twin-arginine translocase subunit TatC [Opitutaceae bacterium]|nr:twin-arginine translocase subunit TatC [Opitutaceae bacterium]